MHEAPRPVTAEELERRPDLRRCELVEGRLVEMSPVGPEHGRVVLQLGSLLHRHLRGRRLGIAWHRDWFQADLEPRYRQGPGSRVHTPGPPAVTPVVKGSWTVRRTWPSKCSHQTIGLERSETKVDEYLTRGVPLVVVVDPDERTVTLHPRGRPRRRCAAQDDVLDLSLVIDGFRCRLDEIFE